MAPKFVRTGHEADYLAWWLHQQEIRQDETVSLAGVEVLVRRNVFSPSPRYTHSTEHLLAHMPDFQGKTLLDVGCGSGIIDLFALTNGASFVTALDCDPAAVANTCANIKESGFSDRSLVSEGDLFGTISGTFDFVIGNLPIVDVAWPQLKEGTQNILVRFLQGFPDYLQPGGVAFTSFASFGDVEAFEALVDRLPYHIEIFHDRAFDVNWQLLKLTMP